jgi:hypothetical protein
MLCYLAGFFDGEGCVYILRGYRSNGNPFYSLEISLTSSDIKPLQEAQALFGGKISTAKGVKASNKDIFRLRLRSNQAASALRAMLPFLIVKAERAEIALEFQEKLSAPRTTRNSNLTT